MSSPESPETLLSAEPDLHLVEPENPLPPLELADLPPHLREAAGRAGWTRLMPVQSRAIPYLRAGRDMMIQSRTGSGKTGAFVLPIIERIDPSKPFTQALVLVPTRELAVQVSREAELLSSASEVRAVAVYGGVGYGPQLDAFRAGAHLVVGTPGRILDHLLRGSLSFDNVSTLVFDEADRLMSMGFYPDMRKVKSWLPKERASFMFSATFPTGVRNLAGAFLREPGFLSLSHDAVHVEEIDHVFYVVSGMDKDRALVRIIEIENPSSAMVFCNTKVQVNYVARVLQRFGYDADQLTADLGQGAREQVLARFRAGQLRFLIATDLAGRGIDISSLSHVVQYDLPEDPESYIHRSGRTGRAGASGTAISIVDPGERRELARIGKRYGIEMEERPTPTDEDVKQIVGERLVALLEQRLRDRDKLRVERMRRFAPLARSLSENDDGLSLLTMLLDDTYQQSLHAPPPGPDGEPSEPSARPGPPRDSGARSSGRGGRGGRSGGGGRDRRR